MAHCIGIEPAPAAQTIYLTIGDAGDALPLLGFVAITVATTIVQEHKTKRGLDAPRDLPRNRSEMFIKVILALLAIALALAIAYAIFFYITRD